MSPIRIWFRGESFELQKKDFLRETSRKLGVPNPSVTTSSDETEVQKWIETHVKPNSVLGFDTETKALRQKGTANDFPPATMQLAVPEHVIVIRLRTETSHGIRQISFDKIPALRDVLESQSIKKVGFDLETERKSLDAHFGVALACFVDISCFTSNPHGGLSNTCRQLLGLDFDKKYFSSIRVGNWEIPKLTDEHIAYAAADAWLSLRCAERVQLTVGKNERNKLKTGARCPIVYPTVVNKSGYLSSTPSPGSSSRRTSKIVESTRSSSRITEHLSKVSSRHAASSGSTKVCKRESRNTRESSWSSRSSSSENEDGAEANLYVGGLPLVFHKKWEFLVAPPIEKGSKI